MGRTWLLRGVAVAVVAVVASAWAMGLAQLGNAPSSSEKPTTPVSSDDPSSTVLETAKPRRTRESDRSRERLTEPSTDTTSGPADKSPGTPAPTSTAPTPDPPGPSQDPSDSSPPPQTPSTSPSQPADDCTDPLADIDCVLDPITGHP